MNQTTKTQEAKTRGGKVLTGVVVSDKMQKTVVVEIVRFVKDSKYQKFHKITKRYKAHDENNSHKIGEKVTIRETRPLSKDKSFVVVESAVAGK